MTLHRWEQYVGKAAVAISASDSELFGVNSAVEDALNSLPLDILCSGVFPTSVGLRSIQELADDYRDFIGQARALILIVGRGWQNPDWDIPEGISQVELQYMEYFYERAKEDGIAILPYLWKGSHQPGDSPTAETHVRFRLFRDRLRLEQLCTDFDSAPHLVEHVVQAIFFLFKEATHRYDVALSFAGEDRAIAREIAHALENCGIKVFFDEAVQHEIWGKDLTEYLGAMFEREARYCLLLTSRHYISSRWARHERQHAQARQLRESQDYLLQVRLDDAEIPGIPGTIAYIRYSNPENIAVLLRKKLQASRGGFFLGRRVGNLGSETGNQASRSYPSPAMPTVRDLLADARSRLALAPFSPPAREATLLLGRILGLSEAQVLARDERAVEPPAAERFRDLLARRLTGEPVAYLFGEREFYGRTFQVDRRVLIPRPETEHVVEEALATRLPPAPWVLDVGTGSGCLAVTLALEIPGARAVATDLSPGALTVSAGNARRLDAGDRVHPVGADLARGLDLYVFDLVVSNPPYIDPGDASSLSPEVCNFEPHLALFAPGAGGSVLARLLAELGGLRPGVRLILEIGAGQLAVARRLAEAAGWLFVAARADYAGIPRVLTLERP